MSQRPIKHRIWDKQLKNWDVSKYMVMKLDTGELALNTKLGLYPIPNTGQKDLGADRYVVQQFTGVLGANNTQIFEGDLLKNTNDYTFEVVYEDVLGSFMLVYLNNEGQKVLCHFVGSSYQLEVIGNIFENGA